MGFSRQEYWSGLPCPPPGDLPDPGIRPMSPASPALQADSLPLSHRESPEITYNAVILLLGIDQKSKNTNLKMTSLGVGTFHVTLVVKNPLLMQET